LQAEFFLCAPLPLPELAVRQNYKKYCGDSPQSKSHLGWTHLDVQVFQASLRGLALSCSLPVVAFNIAAIKLTSPVCIVGWV